MSRAKPPEERQGTGARHTVAATPDIVDTNWSTPAVPDGLSPSSVKLWSDIWELGGPSGVYHPVADYQTILRYVQMTERREELLARLEEEGWTEIGSQGQTVQHPAARILADVEQKMVPLEDRLGLNPQARHTIQIGKVQAQSALEKWLTD